MLEVVLVVVSAELIEDVPDSVQEPFDLNKHVYDRTYAYDFNNVNTFVTTPCEHVPINKYTHEPAPDGVPVEAFAGDTEDIAALDGVVFLVGDLVAQAVLA